MTLESLMFLSITQDVIAKEISLVTFPFACFR